jgi:hypothetical protein
MLLTIGERSALLANQEMTIMQHIKSFSAIALTGAVLGITALTTSVDASALSRFGASPPRAGDHAVYCIPRGHRIPLCFCWPNHTACPSGDVGGTNKWTCKQNGEGCLRQK